MSTMIDRVSAFLSWHLTADNNDKKILSDSHRTSQLLRQYRALSERSKAEENKSTWADAVRYAEDHLEESPNAGYALYKGSENYTYKKINDYDGLRPWDTGIALYWAARSVATGRACAGAAVDLSKWCEMQLDYASALKALEHTQSKSPEVIVRRKMFHDLLDAERYYTGKEPVESTNIMNPTLYETQATRQLRETLNLLRENEEAEKIINHELSKVAEEIIVDDLAASRNRLVALSEKLQNKMKRNRICSLVFGFLAGNLGIQIFLYDSKFWGIVALLAVAVGLPYLNKFAKNRYGIKFDKTKWKMIKKMRLAEAMDTVEAKRSALSAKIKENRNKTSKFFSENYICREYQNRDYMTTYYYSAAVHNIDSIRATGTHVHGHENDRSVPPINRIRISRGTQRWIDEYCKNQKDLTQTVEKLYTAEDISFGKMFVLEIIYWYAHTKYGFTLVSRELLNSQSLLELAEVLWPDNKSMTKICLERVLGLSYLFKEDNYQFHLYCAYSHPLIHDEEKADYWLERSVDTGNYNAAYLVAKNRSKFRVNNLKAYEYALHAEYYANARDNAIKYNMKPEHDDLIYSTEEAKKLVKETKEACDDEYETRIFAEEERKKERAKQIEKEMDAYRAELDDNERFFNLLTGDGYLSEDELAISGKSSTARYVQHTLGREEKEKQYRKTLEES